MNSIDYGTLTHMIAARARLLGFEIPVIKGFKERTVHGLARPVVGRRYIEWSNTNPNEARVRIHYGHDDDGMVARDIAAGIVTYSSGVGVNITFEMQSDLNEAVNEIVESGDYIHRMPTTRRGVGRGATLRPGRVPIKENT